MNKKLRRFLHIHLLLLFVLAAQTFAQAVFDTLEGHVTNGSGQGISLVRITVTAQGGACNWEGTSTTNSFGYYTMQIPADCVDVIVPSHRHYSSFTPNAVLVFGTWDDVNFVANE